MWRDVEKGFQAAFEKAWEAYPAGNIPIGAAILSETGNVAAAAGNQIFSGNGAPLHSHRLAHAEANAILMLPETERSDIRAYTLYTTLEPCPFCFGAITMSGIKRVKFAARDALAGSAGLNRINDYLTRKRMIFEGPFPELETVSLVMCVCSELERHNGRGLSFLDDWEIYCPKGVTVGKQLFDDGTMRRLAGNGADIDEVFDYIAETIQELRL